MPINKRIGIIRARHDPNVPLIPDPACLEMMMTGQHSVFRYWRDTASNYVDFIDSPMFPWVDFTLTNDLSRDNLTKQAIAALRARYPDPDPMKGLDGLIVLVHPGTGCDAGTGYGSGVPAACFPVMSVTHTFMCHEMGHVLGFEHTWGLENDGIDWNRADSNYLTSPEYGSPFDIMSAESFATRTQGMATPYVGSPAFQGPPVQGWPNPSARGMGPNLSRANLHLHWPDALAARTAESAFPASAGAVSTRLSSLAAAQGNTLLILHPPGEPANGAGRVYVEYRPLHDWDQGLHLFGPDLARAGVVVHSLVDQPNVGLRVWYRGVVPNASPDRDVQIDGTSLILRVTDLEGGGQWADISVTQRAVPEARLAITYHEEIVLGPVGTLEDTTTLCGDHIRKGKFAILTSTDYALQASGFGGVGAPSEPLPQQTWTVGGIPVGTLQGTVDVPFGDSIFPVDYQLNFDEFTLRLSSGGGLRFSTPVRATITVNGIVTNVEETYSAPGWFDGIDPDDVAKVTACTKRFTDRLLIPLPPFVKPQPNPPWATIAARLRQERQWFERAMVQIAALPASDMEAVGGLTQMVQQQMQPIPTLLDRLDGAGVDFSVSREELEEWLGDAENTPYPAIALALLRRLDGASLAQAVYIDVIVYNYEHAAGRQSPRRAEEVRIEVLEPAVVEGYNNRYGTEVAGFDDILAA